MTPSRLRVAGLTILQASWGNVSHCGVFTDKSSIPKGTRFGPFQGKLVNTSEMKTYDDNTLMWEVCVEFISKFILIYIFNKNPFPSWPWLNLVFPLPAGV